MKKVFRAERRQIITEKLNNLCHSEFQNLDFLGVSEVLLTVCEILKVAIFVASIENIPNSISNLIPLKSASKQLY